MKSGYRLVLALLIPGLVNAQLFRFGIGGGYSRDDVAFVTRWEDGFVLGSSFFFAPIENLQFGVRGAANRWSADEDAFVTQMRPGVTAPEVDGSRWIIEVVPSIRVATLIGASQVGLFGQFGAGLFVTRTRIDAEGMQLDAPFTQTLEEGTDNDWGLSLGLGVTLGRLAGIGLEFLPLYHIIDPGGDPRQYFTISGAVSFGL